jgi:hypothetical protein
MDVVIFLIRILTAVVAPIATIVFAILTAVTVAKDKGIPPGGDRHCLRCEGSGLGAEAHFHFTETLSSLRDRSVSRRPTPNGISVLGDETHFICDRCAFRYIRNEIIQLILMVLSYPFYLYVIVPMFAEQGVFANFLIETLLVVLSISGFISAMDLYRAVQLGESPLAEARDRVAINERKNALGKKFNYYTRIGLSRLKK